MTQLIDRAGIFQGRVIDYGVKTAKSGAVAVSLHLEIDTALVGDVWEDWREFEFDVYGEMWVVGKTGDPLEWNVRDLAKYLDWDGELKDVANGEWKPTDPVTFKVEADEFEGVIRYRLARLVDPDKPNGGTVTGLDPEEVKGLDAEFGPALRTIAGEFATDRGGRKSRSKAAKKKGTKAAARPTKDVPDDEVPF